MRRGGLGLLTIISAIGVAGGIILGIAGELWGRTPAGNTALVVPFGGGPGLLAGCWAAAAMHLRHGENRPKRLLVGGFVAAVLGLAAALGAAFLPALAPATVLLPALIVIAAVGGIVLAVALAYPPPRKRWATLAIVVVLAIVAVSAIPGGLGFFLAPLLVPLVITIPLFIGGTTGWARIGVVVWIAGFVMLVAAIQAGFYLAKFL